MTTTAEEIMSVPATSIDVDTTVARALEILSEMQVRHLPVLRDGEVVGMISDRDLRSIVPTTVRDFEEIETSQARLGQPVASLMTGDPLTVEPSAEIGEVIDLMLEEKVGAVPVVDPDNGELLGIVSYVDLLRVLRPENG